MRAITFTLFFISGAAGLVYQVAWARSLGVVFGASHLAVATVLAVYMGGQALGSALLGARSDRTSRPLALYGLLELGVTASALAFLGLAAVYPRLYVPLARVAEENHAYLTTLRAAFAVVALIVPTTLMGGTLPALSRFFASREGGLARQLSFLYALNTFGAVAGSLAAGFVLLPNLGVRATILAAAGVSAAVGVAALLLQRRAAPSPPVALAAAGGGAEEAGPGRLSARLAGRLALAGTAISGFCALGYEVLWTRMLTFVVGTSVYSFTIMLVAFLAGIGLGSHAFGLLRGRRAAMDPRAAARLLGGVQVLIGASALAVTFLMRDLPRTANHVQALLAGHGLPEFGGRLLSSFAVAVAYMIVPAFFMGVAFPAAGALLGAGRRHAGAAVGHLLGANTLGAVLGSVASGFAFISLFGIERSLQLLVVVNVTAGLVIAAATARRRWPAVATAAAGALLLVARGASPSWGRVWDQKFFAVYGNTGRQFDTPERVREHLRDSEVLYYHEGVNETVSVIRPRGDVLQTFVVNARPEASNGPMDVQLQRALGHLPMLLHPEPRDVFVLGTGSGMTLGATSIHPESRRIVLAEIEPGVLGVARTFAPWNAGVLDSPKLHVVFDDGRNYLSSTARKFDVITADPIHPWSGGAAYLYTREYFRAVAAHLAPGGVTSQWLPLYELSVQDVRTVLRTFAESFSHVMVWITYYDAVLVGSNDPIVIDERAIEGRLSRTPAIRDDLAAVRMGTAEDLLSYFAMGDAGARAFARGGDLNTDDGLVLEFSAPRSQGLLTDGDNVAALAAARESLIPYLAPATSEAERRADVERWSRNGEAARAFDVAHARFLWGERGTPELEAALGAAWARRPGYAPLRFLVDEARFAARCEPALVADASFEARGPGGEGEAVRISGVRQFVGRGRVLVSFVDNARRDIYAQRFLYGAYDRLEDAAARYVDATLRSVKAAAVEAGGRPGQAAPATADLRAIIEREADRLGGAPRG